MGYTQNIGHHYLSGFYCCWVMQSIIDFHYRKPFIWVNDDWMAPCKPGSKWLFHRDFSSCSESDEICAKRHRVDWVIEGHWRRASARKCAPVLLTNMKSWAKIAISQRSTEFQTLRRRRHCKTTQKNSISDYSEFVRVPGVVVAFGCSEKEADVFNSSSFVLVTIDSFQAWDDEGWAPLINLILFVRKIKIIVSHQHHSSKTVVQK